jgi:hypothetical protein
MRSSGGGKGTRRSVERMSKKKGSAKPQKRGGSSLDNLDSLGGAAKDKLQIMGGV